MGLVVETWGSGVGGLSDPICTEYPSMSNLVTVMPNVFIKFLLTFRGNHINILRITPNMQFL